MSDVGGERPEAALEPEDRARANLYGLVSRLFYAPPDPNFLAEVSGSEAEGGRDAEGEVAAGDGGLIGAWRGLRQACRSAYPAIVRQEYEGLFVGVGRAAVTPYLSAYAEPHSPELYVVRLRGQLAAWGLARHHAVFEVEDHVSGVCDVMRWLIEERRPLAEQRAFFGEFVYAGVIPFLAATQKAPGVAFYQHAADLALQFFEIEKTAFEMDDGS